MVVLWFHVKHEVPPTQRRSVIVSHSRAGARCGLRPFVEDASKGPIVIHKVIHSDIHRR